MSEDQNKDQAASANNSAGEGQDKGVDLKDNANKVVEDADVETKKDDIVTPDKKEGDEDDKDDGTPPETKKRLSTKDFIIGRQRAKLGKGEAKAKADDEGGDKGEGSEGEGDYNDVAPEDEELINSVVLKNFAPILDKTITAEDDKEVNEFVNTNPDFKPFEAKARRYIADPSRRHLPIKTIFYEVAGDKLLKIGAERERQANEKAKGTQTGGGSNRAGEGSKKSVWDLSPEEFAIEQDKVLRGMKI